MNYTSLKMQTNEQNEHDFYILRDDILVQKRAFNALRRMCWDEGQYSVVDMIDKELPRFDALNRAIANNPIVTTNDIKKWRKELNNLVTQLFKCYKLHKQYQIQGDYAV